MLAAVFCHVARITSSTRHTKAKKAKGGGKEEKEAKRGGKEEKEAKTVKKDPKAVKKAK